MLVELGTLVPVGFAHSRDVELVDRRLVLLRRVRGIVVVGFSAANVLVRL